MANSVFKRCVQLDIQRNNGANLFDETTYSERDHMTVPDLISPSTEGYLTGRVCGHEAESHASVIFATSRTSHAGQVKGDDPNKEEILSSSSWGLGREAILTKKNPLLRSLIMGAERTTLVKEITAMYV